MCPGLLSTVDRAVSKTEALWDLDNKIRNSRLYVYRSKKKKRRNTTGR